MQITLPATLRLALDRLRDQARPRLVGGCVRDALLGQAPHDFDVEVGGVTFARLHALLAPLGATDVVGRSFGVIRLRMGKDEYDFSLPRRESKTGAGHRGFAVEPDPELSDAEAAARRDFTINSLAWDPFRDTLIDPFHGQADLQAKILRHTSPAFSEDPLRVLRAMQFAARFDLTLAPETVAVCRAMVASFPELPVERVWGEWAKWATQSRHPARGLAVLAETGWLAHFPELAVLVGTPQDPEWHPEGDVFTHTGHCCDALVQLPVWAAAPAAARTRWMLAVLCHDLGKPATTVWAERKGKLRWISPGHESAGGPLAEAFLRRIGAPSDVLAAVRPLVVLHLAHHHGGGSFNDSHVRRLARKLAPATIDELCVVMMADCLGRPPLHSPATLALIEQLRQRAGELALAATAPRPLLQGRHLVAAGWSPGPEFKAVLAQAFEAQLDGAFTDEAGARAWLLTQPPPASR